ncbi:MAG TPA: hypothetical protein VKQ30_23200 [Ktedonobacterales bacterium]|nr:hypothetical protein [Ktedonobacterales bacterium]
MADKWASIRQYAHTGRTQEFLDANPGLSTADLEQFAHDYPQLPVAQNALAARRAGAAGTSGTAGTASGARAAGDATTAPLAASGSPPPDTTAPPLSPPPDSPDEEGPGPTKVLVQHLKKLDDKALVIPTPGDLGPWLMALVFILFAMVPFNGYTRLQLIWLSLTGAAHVPGLIDSVGRLISGFGGSSGGTGGSGTGGNLAQGNTPGGGTTPPPPKLEAPGGFTPRVVGGGGGL